MRFHISSTVKIILGKSWKRGTLRVTTPPLFKYWIRHAELHIEYPRKVMNGEHYCPDARGRGVQSIPGDTGLVLEIAKNKNPPPGAEIRWWGKGVVSS